MRPAQATGALGLNASSVRALLLTDVVDSTRLAERLGDEVAAALWAAHDRLARDLLRTWHGREIDKTDGFLLLFERVADAVAYARAYHRAIAALPVPLQARVGLHVGPVILRENVPTDVALGAKPLEVEGIAKPVAARVMATALGGQTLLTADARRALGDTDLDVRSHGHWRLQGVAEPVELFEAGDADSPFTPPSDGMKTHRVARKGDLWLPVREIKNNLPVERDAFVGRRETLLELARRIDDGARLISVLGIGGSGKTRLALRFAWMSLGDFPDGAWFCDLAQARSVDGIVRAVADALDVPLGKTDPVLQLGNAIAARGRCLLILDNFEQVSRHADATLGRWLDQAGAARFVVTTRDVLGLPGEQTLALPPLMPADAAKLFVRRATAAKEDFRPTPEDESAIVQLAKLLDGLPLAIELAAARIRVMAPRALLARMNERFKVLASTGGRHDRQATLRATFDWSWDLLSPPDKEALAQLSVFAGGFTLESADAVLDLSTHPGGSSLSAVQSLVDKSFVRQVVAERFDLLVSVQEYAAEHLRTAGRFSGSGQDALAAAEARHGTYFAGLGEARAIADGCAELDNLVLACRRAIAHGAAERAADTLEGAWAALRLRGPLASGLELASAARSMTGLAPAVRARVEWIAGVASAALGQVAEAGALLAAALAAARSAGDRHCEGRVLIAMGFLSNNQGRGDSALAEFQTALALAVELGDWQLEADAHNGLGALAEYQGCGERAKDHFRAALALARKAGDRRREGRMLGNLANHEMDQGNLPEALGLYESALAAAREIGDREWEGNTLCNIGLACQLQGEPAKARGVAEDALALARDMGYARLECVVSCNLGIALDALHLGDEARRRFESALALARRLGDRRSEGQNLGYLASLHARDGCFDEARRSLASGEALLQGVADRQSLGILMCNRAESEQLAGDGDAARAALTEAQAIAHALGAGHRTELGTAIARVIVVLDGGVEGLARGDC